MWNGTEGYKAYTGQCCCGCSHCKSGYYHLQQTTLQQKLRQQVASEQYSLLKRQLGIKE